MNPVSHKELERLAAQKLIEIGEVQIGNGEIFSVEEVFREIRRKLTMARETVSKEGLDFPANGK